MQKTITLSVMLLTMVTTTACSNILSSTSVTREASRYIAYTDTGVNKPDDFPILRATGYATISLQQGSNYNQKMLKAMRASKLEAYKELTEQVYGVYLEASNNMTNTIQTSDKVKSQMSGVVHGARVVRQYPVSDTYVTELELDTKVVYDLYQMRGAL